MPPAARVGDMHVCPMQTPGLPPIPHVGGPIPVSYTHLLKKIRVSPLGLEDGRLHLRVDAASEEEPVTFLLQCDGGVFSAGAAAEG